MAKKMKVFNHCFKYAEDDPSIIRPGRPKGSGWSIEKDIEGYIKSRNSLTIRIMDFVLTIENTPKASVTFSIDGDDARRLSVETMKEKFTQLRGVLRTEYGNAKGSYFICLYDWGHYTKLHMHVLGCFGLNRPQKQLEAELRKVWSRITGFKRKNQVKLVKYGTEGRHIKYMLTPKKNDSRLILLSKLESSHAWCTINPENIVRLPAKEFKFRSDSDWERFLRVLHKEAKKYAVSSWILARIENAIRGTGRFNGRYGRLSGVPQDIVLRAYRIFERQG